MDNKFEALEPHLPGLIENTTAAGEHVTDVELCIRPMKEQCSGTMFTLPYKKLPKLMLIDLVYQMAMWLNAFSVKSGIIGCSPKKFVLWQKLDFKKHCRVQFGRMSKHTMNWCH